MQSLIGVENELGNITFAPGRRRQQRHPGQASGVPVRDVFARRAPVATPSPGRRPPAACAQAPEGAIGMAFA
jgi:hypothetical protein